MRKSKETLSICTGINKTLKENKDKESQSEN